MMQAARFVLTPYYEIMDAMVPLRRLFLDESASVDTNGRYRGRQVVEFSVRYDHSMLLCESKRQKLASFNVRCVIRFCKVNEIRCDEHGIRVKDAFPLHLNIDLNNTVISLPSLLPNDRCGKDGRRFPRPVDLSEGLIDNPIITNRMYLTWVQDDGKKDEYYFAMYLVRLRSCDELSGILVTQHISAIASTLSLVYEQCGNANGAVDDDLVLLNTSINTSLNCPVSRGRIDIPIRGQNCNHLQCFDCMTYLVMNFKKPTWLCPVCDKKIFFCYIEVDGLIFNILKDERSKSVESIQFNKLGQWRPTRKIPGSVTDDRLFYDIKEYVKHSQSNTAIKPNPLLVLNDNLNDYKVEKYLQHILNSAKVVIPSHIQRFPPIPAVIGNQPIKMLYSNCATNHSSVSNGSHYSQPSMSTNIGMSQSCQLGPVSLPTISSHYASGVYNPNTNYNLLSQPSARVLAAAPPPAVPAPAPAPPRYNYNYLPHPVQSLVGPRMPTPDSTVNLQITNVTSMATRPRNTKDIIVISDDESEDCLEAYKTIMNRTQTAHKRPTMASSVPSEVGSSKQVKLNDNPIIYSARPHSASINEVYAQSQLLSKQCKCIPGRLCQAHNENLSFINKIISGNIPNVSNVSRPNDMDTISVQSAVPNIARYHAHSHQTMPSITHPNISSIQSTLLSAVRHKIPTYHVIPNVTADHRTMPAHRVLPNESHYNNLQSTVPPNQPQNIHHHKAMHNETRHTNSIKCTVPPEGRYNHHVHQAQAQNELHLLKSSPSIVHATLSASSADQLKPNMMQRPSPTSELNHSYFNRCMQSNASNKMNFYHELMPGGQRYRATAPIHITQRPQTAQGIMAHTQSHITHIPIHQTSTPDDYVQTQWPAMPYRDPATGSIIYGHVPATHTLPNQAQPLNSYNSYPNDPNVFYNG